MTDFENPSKLNLDSISGYMASREAKQAPVKKLKNFMTMKEFKRRCKRAQEMIHRTYIQVPKRSSRNTPSRVFNYSK